jgi:hypothetical protein
VGIPGSGAGGGGQQVHEHGGQDWPLSHAGQAQPHPVEPEPEPPVIFWQMPDLHGPVVLQAIPRAIQAQPSAASAVQVWVSRWIEQGSLGGALPPSTLGGPPPVPVPEPEPAEPVPDAGTVVVEVVVPPSLLLTTVTAPVSAQLQVQAGQVSPGAQTGQAQAQVPPPLEPPPLLQPPPPPPPPQSQLQGGHACPGAQAGQAQVQVPPPPLPPSSAGGGGQSHATAGQAALGGQAMGCAHAQPPPETPIAWQKPPALQSSPTGHKIPSDDHPQPDSAEQVAWLVIWTHGSAAVQTPTGHDDPAGQATPSAAHEQAFWVSALQASALECDEHLLTSAAGICWTCAGLDDESQPTNAAETVSIGMEADRKRQK